MDLDQGGRHLAARVLDGAGRGHHDQVADLIAPLDVDQLPSLVTVLAVQVDQTTPASSGATGPDAVCELAINAAAPMFGTTPEAILSAERSRPVSDARAVAMTVARHPGLSLPSIAERFNKDHGSVIHAVRRAAERPRLADAAARVSEYVNSRYTARLPRPSDEATVVSPHEQPPGSSFEPDGPVEQAVVAAAAAFGTTPEVLLGPDRTRAAADARSVAMTAARMDGHSLPKIAAQRNHTTVLQATRRIEKTPPLRDLAAKIAADLPQEPAGAGMGGLDVDEQMPANIHRSPGLREQQRAVAAAGERPQLRAAR